VVWNEAAVFCIQSSLTSPLTSSCLSPTPTTSTLLRDGVIAGTAARERLSSAMTLQGHQDLSSNKIWLMLPSPKTGASPPIRAIAASPPNACQLQEGKRNIPSIWQNITREQGGYWVFCSREYHVHVFFLLFKEAISHTPNVIIRDLYLECRQVEVDLGLPPEDPVDKRNHDARDGSI